MPTYNLKVNGAVHKTEAVDGTLTAPNNRRR